MGENAIIQASELAEIAQLQRATEGDLRQCVGQFAQLLVAFKGEVDGLKKDLRNKVTVTAAQARAIQEAVKTRASGICEAKTLSYAECGKALRDAIWREMYAEFTIGSRYDLPAFQFQAAIDFVKSWNSLSLLRKLRDKYGG
jgi:ORF6C domain.